MAVKTNSLIILMSVFSTCLGNNNFYFNYFESGRDLALGFDLKQFRESKKSFIMTDYLSDGEVEKRISFEGVTAKETKVDTARQTLSLWQVSDDLVLLQMIYSPHKTLIDCEFIRRKKLVNEFLLNFYSEIKLALAQNFTSIGTTEYNNLYKDIQKSNSSYDIQNVIPPEDGIQIEKLTYLTINNIEDIPENIKPWVNFNRLKAECFKKKKFMKRTIYSSKLKNDQQELTAETHLERRKRSLSDLLIAPNTKWCGRGHSADNYNELGGASRADKCCRKHDHCKANIQAMSTKWNLFNYRPYTISNCNCDIRFRTCLKMADTADANMVGKLFFNIVQTKCFVIKSEKICKKRSKTGKCEKKSLTKKAYLRENRKF